MSHKNSSHGPLSCIWEHFGPYLSRLVWPAESEERLLTLGDSMTVSRAALQAYATGQDFIKTETGLVFPPSATELSTVAAQITL